MENKELDVKTIAEGITAVNDVKDIIDHQNITTKEVGDIIQGIVDVKNVFEQTDKSKNMFERVVDATVGLADVCVNKVLSFGHIDKLVGAVYDNIVGNPDVPNPAMSKDELKHALAKGITQNVANNKAK